MLTLMIILIEVGADWSSGMAGVIVEGHHE